MKQKIRSILRKLGFDIIRFNPKPRLNSAVDQTGRDPLNDMAGFLKSDAPVIFDVGANVGQSIRKFRTRFPDSKIHSYEPSPATFATLGQHTQGFENLRLWNHAIGSASGHLSFLENEHSDMSSFLPLSNFGWGSVVKESLVEVKTIDQFCAEQNIDRIDILKSDIQGYDFEVFKGAEQHMRAGKVGLIYFEIIFSDMYKNLPLFGEVCDFLLSKDFLLVSFYECFYQHRLASWTDALFVHKSSLQAHQLRGRATGA